MSSTNASTSRYPSTAGEWYYALRFLAFHIFCFAAIWTGVPLEAVALGVFLWAIRMFGVTAGYHRYFSHRTYKMGRVMQFLMALLAQTSMQRGVLWWAAHHRHHHKHSDEPEDVHSVRQDGFFWSHVGWVISPQWRDTDIDRVKDLARYPELRFLNKHAHIPALLMALGTYLWMGWAGLVVGFIWSTVAVWHSTFTINSLAHVYGSRRYETGDDSRNNWILALLTFGEGWHNNHHHYQASTRQGFYWWEIDITYYILWTMDKLRLVSDLREPPAHVVEDRPHPKVALRQAAQQARADFDERVADLQERARVARLHASHRADDLGQDMALRIEEMSTDIEARLDNLRDSIDSVRRGAHDKVKELATDANDKVDHLSQEMAMRMARLRTRAEEMGDHSVQAIDEIAEVTDIQLQKGTTISQA